MVGCKIYQEMKLTCEKLIFGGLGLCRTKNGVVFCEGLAPKETAECVLTWEVGGTSVFKARDILEKSPERRDAFCEHFGNCGGCCWQFINYETQVACKKDIFESTFKRTGKFFDTCEPEMFFDRETNYRIKANFSVDEKSGKIGFLSKKSHKIVEIKNCPLLSENLNLFLENASDIKAKSVAAIDTGSKLVTSLDESVGEILVGDYKFEVNGNSFFQSNRFMTVKIAKWCADQVSPCENLFDIYGGVGLFSVFCSKKAKNITLVEIDEKMVKSAERTFEINSVLNAKSVAASAENFFAAQNVSPDCVIIDPPRIGLNKRTLQEIAKTSPLKIIYISCNPTTQARDCNILANFGYKIQKTAVFDCYPNTFHIESGVVLEK
jgi:tRNA/tmRNA/rRNA uracil-C5-methylase (TrmA/RlmC/RlmD family)